MAARPLRLLPLLLAARLLAQGTAPRPARPQPRGRRASRVSAHASGARLRDGIPAGRAPTRYRGPTLVHRAADGTNVSTPSSRRDVPRTGPLRSEYQKRTTPARVPPSPLNTMNLRRSPVSPWVPGAAHGRRIPSTYHARVHPCSFLDTMNLRRSPVSR